MGNKQNSGKGKSSTTFEPVHMSNEMVANVTKLYKKFANTKSEVGPKDFKMMLFEIGHVQLSEMTKKGNYDFDSLPGYKLHDFVNGLPSKCNAEELAMQLLDADGGGTVDLNEFLAIVDKIESNMRSDRLELFFSIASRRNNTLGNDGINFFKIVFGNDGIINSLTPETTMQEFVNLASADDNAISKLNMQSFKKDSVTETEKKEPEVVAATYTGGKIFIKSLTGKVTEIEGMTPDSDVYDLKQAHQDQTGIPPNQQDISTQKGVLLMENTKLGIYDLSGTLTLVLGLRNIKSSVRK